MECNASAARCVACGTFAACSVSGLALAVESTRSVAPCVVQLFPSSVTVAIFPAPSLATLESSAGSAVCRQQRRAAAWPALAAAAAAGLDTTRVDSTTAAALALSFSLLSTFSQHLLASGCKRSSVSLSATAESVSRAQAAAHDGSTLALLRHTTDGGVHCSSATGSRAAKRQQPHCQQAKLLLRLSLSASRSLDRRCALLSCCCSLPSSALPRQELSAHFLHHQQLPGRLRADRIR